LKKRRPAGAASGYSKRCAKPSFELLISQPSQALQVKNPFDISRFFSYTQSVKEAK